MEPGVKTKRASNGGMELDRVGSPQVPQILHVPFIGSDLPHLVHLSIRSFLVLIPPFSVMALGLPVTPMSTMWMPPRSLG